jgi:hypothetical protein
VNETVNICHEQGKEERMMVPFHVYQAANKAEQFDFLTNQFMGPEKDEDSN